MVKLTKQRRKTDKRQNPSAKVAHRAIHRATKKDANLAKPYGKKRVLAPPKKRRKPRPRQPKPAPREIDIISAIDEAYMEIEALGQEMRDWADSMEDKFSGTQKYDTVNTTADTLENMGNPVQSTGPNDEAEYDFLKKVKIMVRCRST